jgi:Spy/CpxP family protein refolding chaperone
MNSHNTEDTQAATALPRTGRRWAMGMAIAVAVGTACASYASGLPALHGHRDHAAMSPEAMKAHIDKMIEHCAADASAYQKARLADIARAAVDDLRAAHAQFRDDHARGHALLIAPVIDRAALEQWRAGQIQRVDLMSRRVLAGVEDAADVLTPEQRTRCVGHLGMPAP